jgi:hypothetical protein
MEIVSGRYEADLTRVFAGSECGEDTGGRDNVLRARGGVVGVLLNGEPQAFDAIVHTSSFGAVL